MKKISLFWSLVLVLFLWWCVSKENISSPSLDWSWTILIESSQDDTSIQQQEDVFVATSGDDIIEVVSTGVTVIDLSWMKANDVIIPEPKTSPSQEEMLPPEAKKLFVEYEHSTTGELTEDDIDFAEKIIDMVKSIRK